MFYHLFKYLDEAYNLPGSGVFQYNSFRSAAAIILALLIDILNPQRIVIGSIFGRCEALLRPAMEEALAAEALPAAAHVCEIVPAGLGEQIGDYAAIATAIL